MICPEQVFLAVEPVDMRWGNFLNGRVLLRVEN